MQRGHDLYCELEHLREAALLAVQHDRVTGVFNRETMLTILFRETDRVQRLRGVLSLILLDIDDFGHWTEALGKESCNALLREVTVRTGRILRSYDLLGRMGNDEFLLALPGCSTINAVMMAERLRVEVFGDPFLVKDGQKQTVSVRLTACFAVCASRGRSPVVILREAEQTLAITKQSGPDTIRCTGESQLPNEAYSTLARLFPETEILT
jgi:diguanylate cyclase (GGDEF)-like protein